MAKKMKNEYQRFMALTDAQKTAEVEKYEPGRPPLSLKPLAEADKALHRLARARTKGGRPKVGQGAKIVPVSIERGLLKETDRFAKRHKLKRSQMVAEGLKLLMQQRAKAG
jgi:hypothetical protein